METTERTPAYYAVIPAPVRYDPTLIPNAKLLYGEITALCNQKGYCWAQNEYFSKLYGVSKRSISEWISQLTDGGYITREIIYEGKEVKERRLRIADPYIRKLPDPYKKTSIPQEENFAENNTYNITEELRESKDSLISHSEDECDTRAEQSSAKSSEEIENSSNKSSEKKLVVADARFTKFVDYWNTKPHLQHHRPGTKVYARAAELFSIFHLGKTRGLLDLDPKYLKDNEVSQEDLTRAWSEAEIYEAIDRYEKMWAGECGQVYLGKLPKRADAFLYNPMHRTSIFLTKVGKEHNPKPRYEKLIDPHVYALYVEELDLKPTDIEKAELIKGVNFVVQRKKEFESVLGKYVYLPRIMGDSFYHTHINFVRERYVDSGHFTVSHIGNQACWKKYAIWLRGFHGSEYNIMPTQVEIEKAKEEWERTQKPVEVWVKPPPPKKPTVGLRALHMKEAI
jgi:DNA-binding transcriptional ArsR family regulator